MCKRAFLIYVRKNTSLPIDDLESPCLENVLLVQVTDFREICTPKSTVQLRYSYDRGAYILLHLLVFYMLVQLSC